MTEYIPGAKRLVDSLTSCGVEKIFGVPGDTGIFFYDELASTCDRIHHILARDERHAAYMADGYARSSGKLAACEASSGAGAVYTASGLAEAYASSIPVLVITTDIHRRSRGSGAVTEIDQLALFSGVTKWARLVESAEDISSSVSMAVKEATTGRPSPVALIFPENVLTEPVPILPSVQQPAPAEKLRADFYAVNEAVEILASASAPAILAGGGIHMGGAWSELLMLAENSAIPVATSIHGKSSFPESHKLSLGVAGGNGCRGYANKYLANSDAVLMVGTRANATDTNGFTAPPRSGGCRVIGVDIDPTRAGRNYPNSVSLVGDAATVLRQLREALPAASSSTLRERHAAIERHRADWQLEEQFKDLSPLDEGMCQPREVVQILHSVFGPEAWVVADPGTPTPNLSAYWESAGRGWRVVIPRGIGPMGYAISAAIGVALAHPGQRILCLTTESSLAMGIADWETAQRLGLPITYVVLDNTSMAWIKMLQHLFTGARYFGVDPGPLDPVTLARGMGIVAAAASDSSELEKLAKDSLKAEGPRTIHVRVPEHISSPPPVTSWQAVLGGTSSERPVY
ncbi:thiamine pyrophosphate-binding protein [Streptomyces rhizosphaericus]|uniref:Thiamine pyrophosphate-binding protein n=1 Tax=Streptomyces rhizosphaericus TaxID=114699 RepID=A0A6G4AXV2_9ACTN|nr:thiamine pyrophosphate-binding protein [Streptomyces rhizosphaericus]NEW77479.1 thiamine pyrophosphate-binding protein [Streptomyces rhizosphaericus]